MDQNLLLRAVKKHAPERWIVLYIERWLKAPVQEEDGRLIPREKGTPQGGVASPLLANLFLHYGLDRWLTVNLTELYNLWNETAKHQFLFGPEIHQYINEVYEKGKLGL